MGMTATPVSRRAGSRWIDRDNPLLDARTRTAWSRRRLRELLPKGGMLSEDRWRTRHHALLSLLWLHVAAVLVIGAAMRLSVGHAFAEAGVLVIPAVLAAVPRLGPRQRSALVAFGLAESSAVLVHLSGGLIEAHFHFFVVVILLSLYQDWIPFGLSISFVVLHHGMVGTLDPQAVYNHPAAIAHPWVWAGIHAVALLAAAIGALLTWRLNEQQALRDGLTGLATGRLLAEQAALVLTRRGRGIVALIYVDLDGFKAVNDRFGHPVADRMLAEVAVRLQASLRAGDVAARIGGDEFAVLLGDVTDAGKAEEVAARVCRALAEDYQLDGRVVSGSVSVGVATTAESEASMESLMRNADLAMYAAKGSGGGRVLLFDPKMHEVDLRRVRLEQELSRAFDRGEFLLHFQPVIDLHSGEMIGAEALVRWAHPERGLLAPGAFLPTLEGAGMMPRLTGWVLGQACAWARAWQSAHPGERPVRVGVNISPRCLLEPGLAGAIRQVLAEHDLDGRHLCVEVTETAILCDVAASGQVLTALREQGVAVALDDFGTGYSSLTHLRRLPLDIVKIDRSFVAGLGAEVADEVVVGAVLDLARALGLVVVAEGVETPHQLAALRRLGCARAQGYLFSQPVPGDELMGPADQGRPAMGAAFAGALMARTDVSAADSC